MERPCVAGLGQPLMLQGSVTPAKRPDLALRDLLRLSVMFSDLLRMPTLSPVVEEARLR